MKAIIVFICFLSIAKTACCQDNTIKYGSEVTLELTKDTADTYKYVIISSKTLDNVIEPDRVLGDKVDTNQVKLFFGEGKFGDRTQTLLVIKSGVLNFLSYAALIKVAYRDPENTSVEPLLPNVKSIEMWPYKVDEITLSDFKKTSY